MLWDFNWLDAAILIFIFISLLIGLKAGLIKSVFTVVGLIAGLFLAVKYYNFPGSLIAGWISMPRLAADTAGFLAIFLFTAVIVHALGYTAAAVTRFQPLKLLDRLGGLTVGLLLGLALSGLALILLAALPIYATFPDHIEESRIALPIMETTREIFEQFGEYLPFDLPRERKPPEPAHFS